MYTYVVANASAVFSRPQRKGSSTGDMGSQVRGGEEGAVRSIYIRTKYGVITGLLTMRQRGVYTAGIFSSASNERRGERDSSGGGLGEEEE